MPLRSRADRLIDFMVMGAPVITTVMEHDETAGFRRVVHRPPSAPQGRIEPALDKLTTPSATRTANEAYRTEGDRRMDAREIYVKVAERSMLSKEESADLTWAVVETLSMRLSAGEARDLAAQLPERLTEAVRRDEKGPERFGLNELIRRVGKRTGLNEAETTSGVRAVLLTLREAIESKAFNDFMSQLPGEFVRFLEPTSPRE